MQKQEAMRRGGVVGSPGMGPCPQSRLGSYGLKGLWASEWAGAALGTSSPSQASRDPRWGSAF